MTHDVLVDAESLRAEVRDKHRAVAVEPAGAHHFHIGRPLAARLGYDAEVVDALPDAAMESFAGVANSFALRRIGGGGVVQFADIANGRPVPAEALRDIDLWTG